MKAPLSLNLFASRHLNVRPSDVGLHSVQILPNLDTDGDFYCYPCWGDLIGRRGDKVERILYEASEI